MKENILRGFFLSGVLLLFVSFIYPVFAAELRDNDANAIIYGGAYTIDELRSKIQNGSGPDPANGVYGNWQSPNGVRTFFNAIGIFENQFGSLVDGTVRKDGTVWVGGRQIANGVFSAGRSNVPPSTLVNYGPIPIYWREPRHSMKAEELSAFVYRNFDGSFGYAIIKSCGNPITDSSLMARFVTPPPPPPRFSVTIRKFHDKNGNGRKDLNESFLQGWQFKLKGSSIERTIPTDRNGSAVFDSLLSGSYTITEELKSGWISTTGPSKNINVSSNKTVFFGNRRIFNVSVKKYLDANSNRRKDPSERLLQGWEFGLKGGGFGRRANTNSAGEIIFTRVPEGNYELSETLKPNWISTTGQKKEFLVDSNENLFFGNKRKTPVRPSVENSIAILKFRDDDGDKVKDANEPFLKGWEFRLKGNGVNMKGVTDNEGKIIFAQLKKGTYTITEILKGGWTNTTGKEISVVLEGSDDLTFLVGNKEKKRVTPTAEEEEAPEVKGVVTETLPEAGAAEAAMAFSATSLSGVYYYWRRSKKLLLLALKK